MSATARPPTPPDPPEGHLVVRPTDGGLVAVGQPSPAPAGAVQVELPGVLLRIDPADPDRPPSAVVADPDRAHEALGELYGAAVADAALDPGSGRWVRRTDSAALRAVSRSAVLRWLAAAPLPLDRSLLDLERALIEAEWPELWPPDEARCSWADRAPALIEVAGGPVPEPARGLLLRALQQVDHELPMDAAERAALSRARARLAGARPGGGTPAPDPDRRATASWWAVVSGASREVALPAAGTVHRAAADWTRVPVGLLDPGEDAVHWSAVGDRAGLARLHVAIAAAGRWPRLIPGPPEPGPATGTPLVVTVRRPGFPLPLTEFGLRPSPEGAGPASWRGGVAVRGAAAGHVLAAGTALEIDVHRRGQVSTPAADRRARIGAARRWATRALLGHRLIAAVPTVVATPEPLAELVSRLWSRAAAEWSGAAWSGDEGSGDEGAEVETGTDPRADVCHALAAAAATRRPLGRLTTAERCLLAAAGTR